jgi:tripartite-type tricarboxylate transporter receptor subunit TctC
MWNGRVLYRNLPYDPDKAFAPITLFPAGALAFAVHAALPVKTPDEYVAWAAKNPAAIGTYAAGSWPHMIADTWNRTRGLKFDVVHYKGETPMWVDVASGQVSGALGSFQGMKAHVDRGAVRPIAVVGQRRSPRLPDVPTFVEQGHKDPIFALDGWLPMVAPAGTPEDILARVAEGVLEAYQTPKIQQMHESFGIPNGPVPLAEARQRWKDEAPQWVAIADRLGIKLD